VSSTALSGVAVAEPGKGAAAVCAIAEGFPNTTVANVKATALLGLIVKKLKFPVGLEESRR
jgi:hypothetical protein